MAKTLMPVGKPIAFEGDIRKVNQNAYGFFYCNIATPEYLEHPIIQRRVRTKSGIRTIAGLGNWNGWISSTEMDNAINFWYKFEIIKGYKFENDNIFENYVTELYNLRLQYEKGTPMNMIAKLLMNSLYGKFGMTDERTRLEILDNTTEEDKSHVSEFLNMYGTDIIESVELDNYIIIIRNYTELFYNDKYEFFHGSDTNIAIASTITAGARVHMSKFKNNPLFKHFKVNININLSLTLPALAMRIYKSQFMPQNSIYQLGGSIERDIRESYTGGAVDVFIPHNRGEGFFTRLFKTLYYYDVNSLYPFIMANTLMPVGKPTAFEGDIRNIEPEAYGFFYCKITSPKSLLHPILQRKIKTPSGLRTIAGLGSWTGWIFSGEMDNAMKSGYQFEILKGYQFQKGNIFKEYVERMYNLRLQFVKGHPMNLIAKLLLNSLYGKFGMRVESTIIDMFDTTSENELALFNDLLEVYGPTIQDWIKIDNLYLTVRNSLGNYFYNEEEEMFHGLDVNIAIASAITGGARMWMSVFKNSSKFNLYYSDTDNIVIDRQLPSFMVGSALGQMKLEYVIRKAVFLAPKVYGLITTDGKEIIKVKGINQDLVSDIHINDLEDLMFKDASKEFTQAKWFKKVVEGNISVQDVAYTLKVTSNKRNPVYIGKVFENTKPYYYDELINNK